MAGYADSRTHNQMPKLLNVSFSLSGMIREDKETSSFVAYCPELDLYSAGKTRPDAKKALSSAIEMYVRVCYERNILGRLLHEKGFSTAAPAGADPQAMPGNFITITETLHGEKYDDVFPVEVPLHLIAKQQATRAAECLQ